MDSGAYGKLNRTGCESLYPNIGYFVANFYKISAKITQSRWKVSHTYSEVYVNISVIKITQSLQMKVQILNHRAYIIMVKLFDFMGIFFEFKYNFSNNV